jgi:hypothetical protein
VPFDKGYYTEFKVQNLSELWLKKEAFNRNPVLPVQLTNFKATKQTNNDVLVEWTTTVAGNVNRFEIEVAKGNQALQLNDFIKIGEINSSGNIPQPQQYTFTDAESNKTGVRYYRLKMINNDGTFSYSENRPVVFEAQFITQAYPNPSNGLYYVMYQASEGLQLKIIVYDVTGKLIKSFQPSATGFVQKLTIDLQQNAPGLYLIQAEAGDLKMIFKVVKQ